MAFCAFIVARRRRKYLRHVVNSEYLHHPNQLCADHTYKDNVCLQTILRVRTQLLVPQMKTTDFRAHFMNRWPRMIITTTKTHSAMTIAMMLFTSTPRRTTCQTGCVRTVLSIYASVSSTLAPLQRNYRKNVFARATVSFAKWVHLRLLLRASCRNSWVARPSGPPGHRRWPRPARSSSPGSC